MTATGPAPSFPVSVRACLFDMDGVLTSTARLHAEAWKATFDAFLARRKPAPGEREDPFDVDTDYREYVDGRLREDGVRAFLASRHISLPDGSPDDPPGDGSVHALAQSKNERLLRLIDQRGVHVYPGSADLVHAARAADLRTAVVSASANTKAVLASAGIGDLFDVIVDGVVAAERHLAGKPSPETYLAAAADLAMSPSECAVFEDALAGVQAGRAGGFALVVGVNRDGNRDELLSSGATIVVDDLSELLPEVIRHPNYQIEPWCLRESELDLEVLAQSESLFALSNGHLGLRGNLDEGEPNGTPGTYLNSVYESRPLPYGESGYGDPESSESVINVTNGKIIRLLVDDEPFDLRYGTVLDHERRLDFRAGTLTRSVTWRSPTDATVRVRTVRLVSLTQRSVAAIRYEVEAVGAAVRVVLQSELVANEFVPVVEGDPRVAAALENPLVSEDHFADGLRAILIHRTKQSGLRVAAAMDHEIDGPTGTTSACESIDDLARLTISSELPAGERLQVTKYLAYGWSSQRSRPALHDQVLGALVAAHATAWEGLLGEQRTCLDELWNGADIELEGDPEVQQAVRFALFHVFQASYRAERRPIPAKGLTGDGYDGHAFWDTEAFVLSLLTYVYPRAVKDALEWRRSTLEQAEERARQLGFSGAAFPWRTISGRECSGYWPAGTAAFHVNGDIAAAVVRYLDATSDDDFEQATAFELLVATARLWRSLGHHDAEGRFRIDGVTGPDEYSAIANNNIFTNLLAARNLLEAARLAARHRDLAERLGVSVEEVASWRDAGEKIFIPYDERLGIHPQSEGFTNLDRWDFAQTGAGQYPLFLHFPYFDIYRKQVLKQPDLVFAMYICDDAFTAQEKLRNFAYYDALTVRDSSLSANIQAILAAEVGALGLAYDYLGEAALIDLDDRERNTRDGLHLASLAGTWTALVAGFGGLRFRDGHPRFSPRLPDEITKLRFTLRYRGRRLSVTIEPETATYELLEGDPITVFHHGEKIDLQGQPVGAPLPPLGATPAISQPAGRAPLHHDRSHPE